MDSREFVQAYIGVESATPYKEKPEITELMEGPRLWSTFFSNILTQYLEDKEPLDPLLFHEKALEYNEWVELYGEKTVSDFKKLLPSHPKSMSEFQSLNFHSMNNSMLIFWELLAMGTNHTYSDDLLESTQTRIAMLAVDTLQTKRRLLAEDTKDNTHKNSELIGSYDGQLTEYDTLVTLLEVMRQDPEGYLVALPAPHRFESADASNKQNNMDFIMIDRKLKQARGLQAKTFADMKNPEDIDYNASRITMIDGSADLGNKTGVRKTIKDQKTGNSNVRLGFESAPGLLSIEHLQRIDTKNAPYGNAQKFRRSMLIAKSIARELSGNRRPFIGQAAASVKQKVIRDLYMPGDSETTLAAS